MPTQSEPIIIGRGTKVKVATLPIGNRAEIVDQTITTGAIAAANATTITVTALTAPIFASVDSPAFLSIVDANDDTDKFVKVTANAAIGATSLTVAPIKSAIASGSSGSYPVLLEGRTTANLQTSVNDVTTTTFSSAGFEDGRVSRIGYKIAANGNFLPLDAGFRTCLFAFQNFREIWCSIEMTPPDSTYTSGYIFKGPGAVADMPVEIPADALVTCNLSITLRGQLTVVEPA